MDSLVIHNTEKINLIFFIFWLSLILDVVKFINLDSSGVSVYCHNLSGISYRLFPLRTFITFCVLLVFYITSTFGFNLTFCVWMSTISGCFTAASCVLVCFYFRQYSHHPQFCQIYTRALVVEILFFSSLIYYHFLSRLINSP